MPSRDERKEKLASVGRELDKAVSDVRSQAPEVPRLDEGRLPKPPREDARFSRTDRSLDPSGLGPFFEDALQTVGTFHDRALSVLQGYLLELTGKALPTLEHNKALAHRVLELADTFGAKLFFRAPGGEVKQVRLRAVPVARLKGSDSPAAKAGKFSVTLAGANAKQLTDSVTFPLLVAARDLAQAERLFAELDQQEKAAE